MNQDLEAPARSTPGGERPHEARCPGCGDALPSAQFVRDLQGTLHDLGQSYALGEGRGTLQDYCPTCKRRLRGRAYYELQGNRFL